MFQNALKEVSTSRSTPNTPRLFIPHRSRHEDTNNSSSLKTKNATSQRHPHLSRVMSENNMTRRASDQNKPESNHALELKRLYYKKNETSDKTPNIRNISNNKYSHRYSVNDLISFAHRQPLLSQKSYETLSKSQADLFRITAV